MSSLSSGTTTTPSLPTQLPEESWHAQLEGQLAELRQALAVAQVQATQQASHLAELLHRIPASVASPQLATWLLARHPGPVLHLAASGEILYANEAARPLVPTLSQSAGPVATLLHAALSLGAAQQQELCLAGHHYELQVVPAPGSTSAALYLTSSQARHEAAQQLTEEHEFYETILNTLAADVVVFNAEHRFQFVNSSAVKSVETRAWMLGKTDADYCALRQLPPAIAAERQRRFEEARRTRAEVHWEETFETNQGTHRWRRTTRPIFNPDGELHLVIGTSVNITANMLAEQKLAEQQAFYEFILNQLPSDVGAFDAQYRYVFVNERGIKDPEVRRWVIGRNNFDYFARTGRPRAMAEERQAQLERAFQERQLVTFEESFPRPDGTRYMMRCLQPVFHADGSPYLVVGYGLDITERVRAEQTLTEAKLAAEESARVKEAFLANMSHEIRTPMNAILGMSQLLAKTPLADHQLGYQQAIATSAENLLVIINDILDLSKLEAGKLTLEIIGFAPTHLLAQIEQTLRFKAAEKGLSLLTTLDPQLPPVLLGDPHRIRQVLLNLADNAVKFTSKGSVSIECGLRAPAPGDPADTVAVEFCVSDTGIGMDPAYLDRMFDEFSQADSSVTRKFGGTGLGLSICRDLVRLMGGEIRVSSRKNKGTTTQFTLHLPVGSPQAVRRRKLPMPDPAICRQYLPGKHVLLVEDNVFNRQIAKSFMMQAGVAVTEAEHGAQAVELAGRQVFDLILMDVQMPVMDGYAATAVLRQQLGLPTPIIALTANAISGEREKCLAAGMNGYLAKPFQEAQLLHLLLDTVLPPASELPLASAALPAGQLPLPVTSSLPAPPPAALALSLYGIDDLLKAGQGDQEFVVFMLHTFLESCEEAVRDLHQGLQAADLVLLKTTAHTLKPSLQHLNAWQALPPVEKLNKWAADFAAEPLGELVATIEQHLSAVRHQMLQDLAEEKVMQRVMEA